MALYWQLPSAFSLPFDTCHCFVVNLCVVFSIASGRNSKYCTSGWHSCGPIICSTNERSFLNYCNEISRIQNVRVDNHKEDPRYMDLYLRPSLRCDSSVPNYTKLHSKNCLKFLLLSKVWILVRNIKLWINKKVISFGLT